MVRAARLRLFLRYSASAVLVLGGASCNAPLAPAARLSMALEPTTVSVPLGGERSAAVTLTRSGDFNGDVVFSVEGAPAGVTATVTSLSTAGQTTTAMVLVRADAGAKVGAFQMTVRAHAELLADATSLLVLNITEPAAYTLSISTPTVTVARGGIALLNATLARTVFSAAVTLSLEGQQGIAADFGPNPPVSDVVPITVSVASSVAPGTYALTLRGTAAGLADRIAPLTVTVIADAIQLLPQSQVSGFQGSSGSANIIVNRGGFSGSIALSAEGLPAGVTSSFQAVGVSGSLTGMRLDIGPTAAPGSYAVTVRATGAGVPDATAQITLTVLSTVFALSLNPPGVTLLQGTTATTTLTITRTSINRPVVISVEGAPAGLTITPSPASTAGTSSALSVAATSTTPPGQYDVMIRATPEGLPVSTSVAVTLSLTVRTTAPGVGNVLLDWSACTAPNWVAVQDGAGQWTQVIGTSGLFRFNVSSGQGGFAFADGGNTVTVRYMTQAELAARPMDMCLSSPGTKTVNGTASHTNIAEQWVYRLGGGSGTSSGAGPGFAITGVRDGVHDLVVWGPLFPLVQRGLIRRDVDVPNGGSVGTINLPGPEGFTPTQRVLTLTGLTGNEQYGFATSYLTTAACTVNQVSSASAGGQNNFMYGVPFEWQRSDDFHMITASATTAFGSRSASEVFHMMAARTVALAPPIFAPVIAALPGSYKRLQATAGTLPTPYNAAVTLRYSDGVRTMSVSGTVGYFGATPVVLAMPDLSGVSGWPGASAVPSNASGSWVETADGVSANVPLCTEDRRSVSATRTGTF